MRLLSGTGLLFFLYATTPSMMRSRYSVVMAASAKASARMSGCSNSNAYPTCMSPCKTPIKHRQQLERAKGNPHFQRLTIIKPSQNSIRPLIALEHILLHDLPHALGRNLPFEEVQKMDIVCRLGHTLQKHVGVAQVILEIAWFGEYSGDLIGHVSIPGGL